VNEKINKTLIDINQTKQAADYTYITCIISCDLQSAEYTYIRLPVLDSCDVQAAEYTYITCI